MLYISGKYFLPTNSRRALLFFVVLLPRHSYRLFVCSSSQLSVWHPISPWLAPRNQGGAQPGQFCIYWRPRGLDSSSHFSWIAASLQFF